MPVLYLTEQGAVLQQEGRRLKVVKDGGVLADLPLLKLEAVLVYGHLQLTTQAMRMLLREGIQTSFLTLNGRLIGHLRPVKSRNSPLRMAQYLRVHDREYCLRSARRLVSAKLRNCQHVLERYLNNHPVEAIREVRRELDGWQEKIGRKQTPANLLGVEGSGTQRYYDAFRLTFRHELRFLGRNRRPPRDPVNALLSFGYTLLGNELTVLCETRGLDPYLGVYHGIQYGRPSLALDILEPFRPAWDLAVLTLANKRILQPGDFEPREGGVYLTATGLKTFFRYYEQWIQHRDRQGKSIRQHLRDQVGRVAEAFQQARDIDPYSLP